MISTKTIPHKQQILVDSSCSSCHTAYQLNQPEKLRNPVQKRSFYISQHFTELYPNTPLYLYTLISVLYFPKSASGLPNPNSLWEGGEGRIFPCSDQQAVHTEACSQARILNLQKSFLKVPYVQKSFLYRTSTLCSRPRSACSLFKYIYAFVLILCMFTMYVCCISFVLLNKICLN